MKTLDFILFGATGDLAMRKIFPSLFAAFRDGFLPHSLRIIATSRSEFSKAEFESELQRRSKIHIEHCDEKIWGDFTHHIHYVSTDLNKNLENLKEMLGNGSENIVIYLSISPEFFIKACKNLAAISLNDERVKIVLEKPLGRDLKSCNDINDEIAKYYKEEQIYRIDHYLGKESIQNILFLRAYNPFLSSLWNKEHIECVEITVFETLGVENRGEFYERMGALRDMLQNHMLQILSLVSMKIPQTLNADSIRVAKCEILKSLKTWDKENLKNNAIRAQYAKSGELRGYVEEENVAKDSKTETFCAIKTELLDENWRGVPFYLRTGKRMAKSFVQVVITFKNNATHTNKLIISLQPQSNISLNLAVKKIGKNTEYEEKMLNLNLDSKDSMQPYERLILDVIDNNPTSFNHKAELEAAWKWTDPILESWQNDESPLYYYPAGSHGPMESFSLLQKDGHSWHNA